MFFEPAQQGGTDTEQDSVVGPAEQGHSRMMDLGAQRVGYSRAAAIERFPATTVVRSPEKAC